MTAGFPKWSVWGRLGAAALFVASLCLASPAWAGSMFGAGDWRCTSPDLPGVVGQGPVLSMCLAHLAVEACGRAGGDWTCLFELGRLQRVEIEPKGHDMARALSRPAAARDRASIALLIEVAYDALGARELRSASTKPLRRTLAGIKARTGPGVGCRARAGARYREDPWAPTAAMCLADLILGSCPEDVGDPQRCMEAVTLEAPAVYAVGSGTASETPAMPPPAEILLAMEKRVAQLSGLMHVAPVNAAPPAPARPTVDRPAQTGSGSPP